VLSAVCAELRADATAVPGEPPRGATADAADPEKAHTI
jgi:hypothetical protein